MLKDEIFALYLKRWISIANHQYERCEKWIIVFNAEKN